jgi:Fe-S cluster assembly protein SufD
MNAVVDFPVKPEARDYLARFARDEGEPGWLAARRQQAMTRFAELGFPSRKNEDWRYFDLQPLERKPLLPAHANPDRLASMPADPCFGAAARIFLADGECMATVARHLPAGAWLASLKLAVAERPEIVRGAFEETAGDAAHPFAALNTAFFSDGYVLDVAAGVALGAPIEIVHFGASEGSLHTRSLVKLGEGARVQIIETYAGEGRYWTNDVLAVRLADGAELTRIVLVEEPAEAIHLGQLDASLGKGARLTSFALLLGGKRVRHEANVTLGESAQCRIDGAYLVTGSDEANIVTSIDHAAPGGTTSELVKGVAAGRGHGAFQGRITVREHAQKTDAHQLSRNLIIGGRAAIDTKPELEIYADDVKCSHGASVGDLDEAAMFYLRARGITEADARRMLIEGFLREAVEEVGHPAVREHLLRRLAARLENLEA